MADISQLRSGFADVISDAEFQRLKSTPPQEPPVLIRSLNTSTITLGLRNFIQIVRPQHPDQNRHWFFHHSDPMNPENFSQWAIFIHDAFYYLQSRHVRGNAVIEDVLCLGDGTTDPFDFIYRTCVKNQQK
jgi:hypothetical protein